MSLYPLVVTALGTLAVFAFVLALALAAALFAPGGRAFLTGALAGRIRHPIAWAWIVALIAMGGSLYFSDVVGLVPCLLCWYQRIAMYPLVLVLGVGWIRNDPGVWRFALPLPVVGFVVSAYHVALQYQPSLDLVSCNAAAPCTARYMAVFGFVSIPMMAGVGFLLIGLSLLVVAVLEGEERPEESSSPAEESP